MALSKSTLKDRIIQELEDQGFVTDGEHSRADRMAQAIANAVVDEIQQSAEVEVTSGSSAGIYQVN